MGCAVAWSPMGVGEGGEQARGDARGDQGVAVGGRVDGLGEQGGPGVLEQEPPGAGLQRPVHVLVEVEGGDDDDRQRVVDVGAGELPGGLDPVHLGHADVEQADVGAQRAGKRDRLTAVGGLSRRPRCRAGRRGSSTVLP